MESKSMTQYREITVKVLVMDSKENDSHDWLVDTITDGLLETDGERIISVEIGQPVEK